MARAARWPRARCAMHLPKLCGDLSRLVSDPTVQFIVDSTPASLRSLDELTAHYDVWVIHLTRDVRSWVAGQQASTGKSLGKLFKTWANGNRDIQRTLSASGRPVFNLGYEEFALRPAQAFSAVCAWLNLPYSDAMLSPAANTKSHIISGNVAVKDANRASQIQYDGSWMANADRPIEKALRYAAVAKLNRKLVYSNDVVKRKS